jgi:hypothetical protein
MGRRMMLAALLLLAQQPQTVTFSHPCANSAVVLGALGRQTGLRLAANGSVEKDYFLVRFDNVPLGEALAKIATALNATWTERAGVRYLGRTAAQDAASENELRARLERSIASYIANDAKKVGSWSRERARELLVPFIGPNGDLDRTKASAATELNGPCKEMLDEFIRAVGAAKLASLPDGKPVTFRWSPKKGEQPIPPSLRSKADAFAKNVNTFGDAARSLGVPMLGDFDLPAEVRLSSGTQPVTPDWIAFQAHVRPGSVYVIMMPNGTNPAPYASVSVQARRDTGPRQTVPDVTGVYAPSALARAYAARIQAAFTGSAKKLDADSEEGRVLFPWLREGMSTPDMAHLAFGECVVQAVEAARLNAVVVVSDFVYHGMSVTRNAGKPLKGVLEQLALGDSTLDLDGRWFLVYPPLEPDGSSRFDRAAVSELALAAHRDGRYRIEPLAKYALSCDNDTAWNIGCEVAGLAMPLARPRQWTIFDGALAALKLYASLPTAMRKSASSDWFAIAFEDLPRNVQGQLTAAHLKKAFGRARYGRAPDAQWSSWTFAGNFAGEKDPNASELAGCRFEVRLESADLLAAPDKKEGSRLFVSGMYGVEEAAKMYVQGRESPQGQLDYSQFADFTAERLQLRLRLADGETLYFVFTTDSRNAETRYYPVEQLPGEVGEKLRAEIKRIGGSR